MDEESDTAAEETEFVYPRIENIYWNATNIKTEPVEYEENEYEIAQYEPSNDYYMSFPNKIILGSKPSTKTSLEPMPQTSTAPDVWSEQKSYDCDECSLFFPTENELDSHKMATHSYLVARPMSRAMKSSTMSTASSVSSHLYMEDSSSQESSTGRQKAVKSTAKSSLLNNSFPLLKARSSGKRSFGYTKPVEFKREKTVEPNYSDHLLCKHCDVRFPNDLALIKHTYELLPEQKFPCDVCSCTFNSKEDLSVHSLYHKTRARSSSLPDDKDYLQCTVCSCYLQYPTGLKNHMLKNHRIVDYTLKLVKFHSKCVVCSKQVFSQRQYNKHIANIHTKLYTSRGQVKALKHPAGSRKHASNPTKNNSYPKAHQLKAKPKAPPFRQSRAFTVVKDPPIPRRVLFKCNKCQIHFVSCSKAYEHSKCCILAKGDWKCNKCRRSFTHADRLVHAQQHGVSDKFEVHTVDEHVVNKVVCRCPKCELHFDEYSFWRHVSAGCVPQIGVDCSLCHLAMDKESHVAHRRYHNVHRYTRSDFVVIEFADAGPRDDSCGELTDDSKHNSKAFLFCSNCKTHISRLRGKHFHTSGKCQRLDKRYCLLCGLLFTYKTLNRHTILAHQKQNMKLTDFTFTRIQDNKQIVPPVPEFYQCSKCSVRVSTLGVLKAHDCKTQVSKQCSECLEKYDAVTYDLHLSFHEYEKQFQDEASDADDHMNIYSCLSCKYGFYSYDSLVEHCQNHYNDTETLAATLCKLCRLSYVDTLHRAMHASRQSYRILKFNHEALLSDDWFSGFGPMRKDKVDKELAGSVYGVLRNVRLQMLFYGPRERSLYRCVQCQLCIEPESVVEHTAEPCAKTAQHRCGSCEATFKSKISLHKHTQLHVVYGDDIKFTLIAFNNAADKDLNEALKTGKKKESLKFRKCQQCGLLIKKHEYQAHIDEHNKSNSVRVAEGVRMKKDVKIIQTHDGKKKMYTVYQCRGCKSCIMNKVNISRHNCAAPNSTERCSKCSLWFRTWSAKRHDFLHTALPKFVTNNITVLEFELHGAGEPVAKRRRRYSSDDDTSVVSTDVSLTVQRKHGTRLNRVGKVFDDYTMESEDSQDTVERVPRVKEEDVDESLSIPEINKWIGENKSKLYQCRKCYVCFVVKKVLLVHQASCDADGSSAKAVACSKCDLIVHPSLMTFHENLHESVNSNVIHGYFYLIQVSTNGIDEFMAKNWLYKCKSCNVYYITYQALEYHFSQNHKTVQDYVTCEKCNLRFTLHTRPKHMRLHHYKNNRIQNNFNVEIAKEGIVQSGKFSLSPFDASDADNEDETEVNNVRNGDDNDRLEDIGEDNDIDEAADKIIETDNENETVDNVTDTGADAEAVGGDVVSSKAQHIAIEANESPVDNNLYKCTICGVHFLTKHSLLDHVDYKKHHLYVRTCYTCRLGFNSGTYETHVKIQHETLKLKRKDFIITTLTGTVMERDPSSASEDESYNFDNTSDDEDFVMTTKMKRKVRKDRAAASKPANAHAPRALFHNVYKCVECSIHYTNKASLLTHAVTNKHAPSDTRDCDVCGLTFDDVSLAIHKRMHHDKFKLTLKDLIIIDADGSRVRDGVELSAGIDARGASSNAAGDATSVNKNELVKRSRLKIFELYQCNDCGVCVRKIQRRLHVCCSDLQKKYCVQCSLCFNRTDLPLHRRLHRKYGKLSRRNFTLIKFGRQAVKRRLYKCSPCSTHFVSLATLEWHMDTWKHNTKRVKCNICGLYFGKLSLSRHIYIHHTKLNLTVGQYDVVCVDLDNGTTKRSHALDLNVKPEPAASESNSKSIVLFKCFECDVFFLSQASYYHHMYQHTSLDPTEFIACKMCDLQFLTNALGEHMKGHRDRTFSLDNVVIEGYQHSSESPKVERLSAVDRLNSKLVSTTTPFDEDVKVSKKSEEQLSTVDSTSDEVPRASQSVSKSQS